jgi:hypothetical protein
MEDEKMKTNETETRPLKCGCRVVFYRVWGSLYGHRTEVSIENCADHAPHGCARHKARLIRKAHGVR